MKSNNKVYVTDDFDSSKLDSDVISALKNGFNLDPDSEVEFIRFAPSAARYGGAALIGAMKDRLARKAMETAQDIVMDTAGKASIFVSDKIDKASENIKSRTGKKPKSRSDGKSSNGGGSNADYVPNEQTQGTSLTKSYAYRNDKTTSLMVKTPLPNDVTYDDLKSAKVGVPVLHISGARFSLQTKSINDDLYKRFANVVAIDFQNLAQRSVNYGLDVVSVFSAERLTTYFNAIANALQVYYFYTSIIAYEDNIPHNKNGGMSWFRDKMTVEEMNLLEGLNRALLSSPIPPRLNQICFYLMQNYKLTPDSSIGAMVKFMPFAFDTATADVPSDFGNNGQVIQSAIDGVLSVANRDLASKIASVLGGIWFLPELLVPAPTAIYDPTFCTIWSNHGYAHGTTFSPTVANDETVFDYYTCCDSVDNLCFGLASAYSTADAGLRPGLLQLVPSLVATTSIRTRFSCAYLSKTNAYTFESVFITPSPSVSANLALNRNEAHIFCTTYSLTVQPVGYNKVSRFTIQNIRYTAKYLIEWLFELGTIQKQAESNEAKRFKPSSVK